jgi:hypothetical protein
MNIACIDYGQFKHWVKLVLQWIIKEQNKIRPTAHSVGNLILKFNNNYLNSFEEKYVYIGVLGCNAVWT